MSFTEQCNEIFNQAIRDYHVTDNVDTPINNPYDRESIENRLYLKCWIDTVQWHFEDLIRDPHISPEDGMSLKHRIDRSNQDRTDLVEQKDLSLAIDQLLDDIRHGRKYMKVYRQMKMYNDPSTNPILYKKK